MHRVATWCPTSNLCPDAKSHFRDANFICWPSHLRSSSDTTRSAERRRHEEEYCKCTHSSEEDSRQGYLLLFWLSSCMLSIVPVPQALWRSKQSSPSSGSNICLSLTACSMAPGSLWLEHTMSFSVMSTQICSDNVKAFRSFGQLRFAASSGLHSRDDTAPCVTLSSLQFQQTPRAQRCVTRF